jgi:hypothetical protein
VIVEDGDPAALDEGAELLQRINYTEAFLLNRFPIRLAGAELLRTIGDHPPFLSAIRARAPLVEAATKTALRSVRLEVKRPRVVRVAEHP